MKKFQKRLLALMLAAVMVLSVNGTVTVKAADNIPTSQEYTLVANDTWVSGSIQEESGVNFYLITLTQAGSLTVDYQGWDIADSYCEIWDNDMTTRYEYSNVYNSSNTNPKTKSFTNWMEAGTYVVKIYASGSHTGNYKLKASFSAANNNETEPNNEFNSAMQLSANNLVTGLISREDSIDFYQITLNSTQTIMFTYLAYIGDSYFKIWNDDFQEIENKNVYGASETAPKTYTYETTLSAGTYYVQITPCGNNYGRYVLKYQNVQKVTSIKISGNKSVVAGKTLQLKATVSPSKATDKTVSWSSDNTSVASVDANTGKVTTLRAGVAHITATAQDGGKASKSVTVVVLPKKVSSLNANKSYWTARAIAASWDYQSGVSGYQVSYSTNKNFKNAKTKTVSSNSISLTGLKKNTKYYVRVRAYINNGSKKQYGAWSAVKSSKAK